METVKKNKVIIILLFLAFLCLFFSAGKIGNIFTDVGREAYYPLEILNKKVLYRDIFCIYGPFSYLFNALLYKIFGAGLNVLYAAGGICALFIVGLTYKISKIFLNNIISILITFFIITAGCLSGSIFNFTLPYSYAILYGLTGFLFSIYFLMKFLNDRHAGNLIASGFFCGLAVSNKYDFILYLFPLLFVIFKEKNFRAFFALLFGILTPFIVLFITGAGAGDLYSALKMIFDFSRTNALQIFYRTQGVYFTSNLPFKWGALLCFQTVLFSIVYFGLFMFEKNIAGKIFGSVLIFFAVLSVFLFAKPDSCLFLTFAVAILFISVRKRLSVPEFIFILSAILISLKSFWGLSHVNYGLYFAGVILISFFILISKILNKKAITAFCLLFFGLISNCFFVNALELTAINGEIKTDRGKIYTYREYADAVNGLIEYILKIEKENPVIAIFPEGQMINFLSAKKNRSDLMYGSLIPLYTEAFGEDRIIEHYKNNPPDYVVFSNIPEKSYGQGAICSTYAKNFCKYVKENYIEEDFENPVFTVYKKH